MDSSGRLVKRAQDTFDGIPIIPSSKFCNNAVGKSLFLISTFGYFFCFFCYFFTEILWTQDPGLEKRNYRCTGYGYVLRYNPYDCTCSNNITILGKVLNTMALDGQNLILFSYFPKL